MRPKLQFTEVRARLEAVAAHRDKLTKKRTTNKLLKKVLDGEPPVGVEAEIPRLFNGQYPEAFLQGGKITQDQLNLYNSFVSKAFDLSFRMYEHVIGGRVTVQLPKQMDYHGHRALINGDGRLHPESIVTIAEAVSKLIPGQNFAINGLPQTAKTISQAGPSIIGSVVHFIKTGKICRPVPTGSIPSCFRTVQQERCGVMTKMEVRGD